IHRPDSRARAREEQGSVELRRSLAAGLRLLAPPRALVGDADDERVAHWRDVHEQLIVAAAPVREHASLSAGRCGDKRDRDDRQKTNETHGPSTNCSARALRAD